MQQREILFRGQYEKGKWAFGHYAYCFNYPDDSMKKHWILDGETEDGQRGDYEIDPSTLGQYTGLKDVNSVKIFERDILRVEHDGNIGESFVVWGYDGWKLNSWTPLSSYPFFHQVDFSQVVGNIDDNPELINQ